MHICITVLSKKIAIFQHEIDSLIIYTKKAQMQAPESGVLIILRNQESSGVKILHI